MQIAFSLPVLLVLALASAYFINCSQTKPTRVAGCRKLGLRGKSNLRDQLRTNAVTEDGKSKCRIKSIWIYPIKSCRGVELEESIVVSTGLQYDRQFLLAQMKSPFPASEKDSDEKKAAHEWKFITQREFPRMALIRTEMWVRDPSAADYSADLPDVRSGGALVVTFPYAEDEGWRGLVSSVVLAMISPISALASSVAKKPFLARLFPSVPVVLHSTAYRLSTLGAQFRLSIAEKRSFKIPFEPDPTDVGTKLPLEEVAIWKDSPTAINMGSYLPAELKYFLGVRNPLVLFRVATPRLVMRTAPKKETLGWQPITGFADYFPLLILGLASVRDICDQQPDGSPPLDIIRFRPNVITTGAKAYAEDFWKRARLGAHEFYSAGRCTRCRLPNVDPQTGERYMYEPDKTLRTRRDVDPGAGKGKGCLGVNMCPALQEGVLRVGDEVDVLELGEIPYQKI